MTFQIIIKGEEEARKRLKGKNISEFAKNIESIGWPTEFPNEEARDRAKFIEEKEGRPLRKSDSAKIAMEMGVPARSEQIKQIAAAAGAKLYKRGQPEPE